MATNVMLRVSRSIHAFSIFWIATPGFARLAMTHTMSIMKKDHYCKQSATKARVPILTNPIF
ncbi:MAG: hypothetical protein RBR42_01540 [Desulfomicrobium sp.]|nr:hypothetical protein [Desulfomicrobium sp.]